VIKSDILRNFTNSTFLFDFKDVSDEENYIEEPAMTDKDIEIEKIIERHLGKPSQTLSYPSQEEETSLKSNKSLTFYLPLFP
jgi:hypothetical protein